MQRKLTTLLPILSILCIVMGFTLQNGTKAEKRPRVEVRTELGTLVVELYNETPGHRDNFLKLVKGGFYDSLLWHRIIPQFMVQGGDPNSKRAKAGAPLGASSPTDTIPAEIKPGLIHKKGALAAARQGDQVNPRRASSKYQFYIVQGKTFTESELKMFAERNARAGINTVYTPEQIATYATLGGAPHLDGAYTVFGEVVQGLDVLDKLASVERGPNDRPLTDVHMWMRVLK